MAAQEAQKREARSSQQPMLLYRFIRVLRTGRKVAARRREQRRNEQAVATQHHERKVAHQRPIRPSAPRRSSHRAANATSHTELRAITIMSTAFAARSTVPSAARIRRRTRLRSTAPRRPLPGMMPTRGRPAAAARERGAATIAMCAPSTRRPRRRTRANSASPLRLSNGLTPLGREPLSPLLAACSDDAAAVLGRHPRQKAVDSLAPPIVGLERPLHDDSSGTGTTACDYTGGLAPRSRSAPEMRAFRRLSTPVDKAVENAPTGAPQSAATRAFSACRRFLARVHNIPKSIEK